MSFEYCSIVFHRYTLNALICFTEFYKVTRCKRQDCVRHDSLPEFNSPICTMISLHQRLFSKFLSELEKVLYRSISCIWRTSLVIYINKWKLWHFSARTTCACINGTSPRSERLSKLHILVNFIKRIAYLDFHQL